MPDCPLAQCSERKTSALAIRAGEHKQPFVPPTSRITAILLPAGLAWAHARAPMSLPRGPAAEGSATRTKYREGHVLVGDLEGRTDKAFSAVVWLWRRVAWTSLFGSLLITDAGSRDAETHTHCLLNTPPLCISVQNTVNLLVPLRRALEVA